MCILGLFDEAVTLWNSRGEKRNSFGEWVGETKAERYMHQHAERVELNYFEKISLFMGQLPKPLPYKQQGIKIRGVNYIVPDMISYAGDFTAYPTKALTDYDPAKYGISDGRDIAFGPNPDVYADFSNGLDRDVQLRFIIQPHHKRWAIPLDQLNSVGMETFGQNEGY